MFAGGAGGAGSEVMYVTLYAVGAGGDAPCVPYAGGCGEWALFVGGAGGDALCDTRYARGCVCLLEVLEAMRCMLLCMLLCLLEAVEGELCLREVLEVPEVSEVM